MTKDKKKKILLDCGTSYAKIMHVESGRRSILSARKFMSKADQYLIEAATGHNAISGVKRTVNELVALARGGLALVSEPDFIILDCGARDIKYVEIKKRKVRAMDWNTECGAFTGQVIDLLSKHFELDTSAIPQVEGRLPVVCGVLGMTAMFDSIAHGTPHDVAFAEFLRGVAFNCQTLVGRPERLYLSGGLCDNPAFINSFSCETIPLGRFVLLEGLKHPVADAGK